MQIKPCQPVANGVYQGHWGFWSIHKASQFFMWRSFGTYRKHYSN